MKVKIKRFTKDLPLPNYEKNAAGFDFYCKEDTVIKPKEIKLVKTNNAIQVPEGFALLLVNRSSTPLRKGLALANGIGIIDSFFCGDNDEILIEFFNFTDKPVEIKKGEKLAQGIFVKFETANWKEVEKMPAKGIGGYKTEN